MITKNGKIEITEENVVVSGFTFCANDKNTPSPQEEVLLWTAKRIADLLAVIEREKA